MAKKLFGLIAAAILAFAGAIFVACGGGEDDTLTLSGFDVPAETQVAYGSIYTIPDYVVTDRNGTIYTVEVVVTNGGETITPVGGQIDIDRMTDYTITFTVVLGEGNTQQKQTILKVVDGNAPRVTLGEMQRVYIVGEDIALPTVEIADNIDTGLTAQFSVRSGGETVLASVTDSFKLETAGAYELVATVTDSSGNIGTDTANFVVRAAANIGEIEDFADEYAALSVTPVSTTDGALTGEMAEIGGQTAFKIKQTFTITIFEPEAFGTITVAEAEDTISQIVPRGNGTDKTDNSYVADFNGRDAIMAETNPETSSSNANSSRWPSIDIHTPWTVADLQWFKAQGYTTMVIPVYITDSSVNSLDIYYGPDGALISAVATGEWVELEIPIDTVIGSYDTTLSNYFIYINNYVSGETIGGYITYYIADITLTA